MKIEGGCLCGNVRYSADAEPAFVGVCHCKNCQKASGTAFRVVLAVPKPALSVQGTLKTFNDRGETGKAMIIKVNSPVMAIILDSHVCVDLGQLR